MSRTAAALTLVITLLASTAHAQAPAPVGPPSPTLPRDLDLEQQILDLKRANVALEQRVLAAETSVAAMGQMVQTLLQQHGAPAQSALDRDQETLDRKKVAALGGDWAHGDRYDVATKTLTRTEKKVP